MNNTVGGLAHRELDGSREVRNRKAYGMSSDSVGRAFPLRSQISHSVSHIVIHTIKKHFTSTYYVPGFISGFGDTSGNRQARKSATLELTF